MPAVRRNYKDSLFCHLFGSEEGRDNALELYNALAGTSYADAGELELTTIGNVVFLGRKNDVSFLVGDEMVLWEHQSTHNPNMPLRGLQYFSRLYAKYVESRDLDLFGSAPLVLPTPRYVVFYFGRDERPDREVLALSDSFASGPGDLEVTVTVLNCNEGRNAAIMEASEALRGYARLLALARGLRSEGADLNEAVSAAVARCIDEGVLADYLRTHRMEVEDMLFTIEDEERALRVHREAVAREAREKGYAEGRREGEKDGREEGHRQGREEGRKEGRKEGRFEATVENVRSVMSATGMGADEAFDLLQVSESDRLKIQQMLDS